MIVKLCDICKKNTIENNPRIGGYSVIKRPVKIKYKVKALETTYDSQNQRGYYWNTVDVCEDCIRRIIGEYERSISDEHNN